MITCTCIGDCKSHTSIDASRMQISTRAPLQLQSLAGICMPCTDSSALALALALYMCVAPMALASDPACTRPYACAALQCDAMRCDAMRCGAVECSSTEGRTDLHVRGWMHVSQQRQQQQRDEGQGETTRDMYIRQQQQTTDNRQQTTTIARIGKTREDNRQQHRVCWQYPPERASCCCTALDSRSRRRPRARRWITPALQCEFGMCACACPCARVLDAAL